MLICVSSSIFSSCSDVSSAVIVMLDQPSEHTDNNIGSGAAEREAYLGELSCAAMASALASRARRRLALGLRIAASIKTMPSNN